MAIDYLEVWEKGKVFPRKQGVLINNNLLLGMFLWDEIESMWLKINQRNPSQGT